MKHFILPEIVDRVTYAKYGEDAWTLFHPDALEMLDGIREFFNVPVTVNNWWDGGGSMQYRGYRPPECTVGAPGSYHRRGMAFDFDVKGIPADEARKIIADNKDHQFLVKIQRMEDKVTWCHADIGTLPAGKSRIYFFKI